VAAARERLIGSGERPVATVQHQLVLHAGNVEAGRPGALPETGSDEQRDRRRIVRSHTCEQADEGKGSARLFDPGTKKRSAESDAASLRGGRDGDLADAVGDQLDPDLADRPSASFADPETCRGRGESSRQPLQVTGSFDRRRVERGQPRGRVVRPGEEVRV